MDFLVKREDLRRVCDRLVAEGYTTFDGVGTIANSSNSNRRSTLFRRGPISLEPHWSITARRFPFEIDYDGLPNARSPSNSAAVACRPSRPKTCLLILCVCGAKAQMATSADGGRRRASRADVRTPRLGCVYRAGEASGARACWVSGCISRVSCSTSSFPPQWSHGLRTTESMPRLTSAALAQDARAASHESVDASGPVDLLADVVSTCASAGSIAGVTSCAARRRHARFTCSVSRSRAECFPLTTCWRRCTTTCWCRPPGSPAVVGPMETCRRPLDLHPPDRASLAPHIRNKNRGT